MFKRILLLASLISATASFAANGAAHKHLADSQMRRLAIAGVRATAPGALRLTKFGLDRNPGDPYAGRYVGYEATAEPPVPEGSVHVGSYVIDPRTGDMWDGVSECGIITSPEIRRLQRAYRKQLSLSATDYSKIKRRGPMCDQR